MRIVQAAALVAAAPHATGGAAAEDCATIGASSTASRLIAITLSASSA
jgi:hypothetical protein